LTRVDLVSPNHNPTTLPLKNGMKRNRPCDPHPDPHPGPHPHLLPFALSRFVCKHYINMHNINTGPCGVCACPCPCPCL
jgi:hypothetical protein